MAPYPAPLMTDHAKVSHAKPGLFRVAGFQHDLQRTGQHLRLMWR